VSTSAGSSTAVFAPPSVLSHVPGMPAVSCIWCRSLIEIPAFAVLEGTLKSVRIAGQPLNLILWREEQERKHAACAVPHLRQPFVL
jgi:hypothetical protein